MSKKVLFCATVVSHLTAFHLPYLNWFKEQGWEVHAAAHGAEALPFADRQFNISLRRSPFHPENFKAYHELKRIIKENGYDIIHCHTPMGGALARLAARFARRRGTRVIYTAHGFHFFTGASRLNWLVYYPAEKFLSRYTDCLITINREDYGRVLGRRFKAGTIAYVHGVGIDFDKYKPVPEDEKRRLRTEYQIGHDQFVLIYAAELIKRKNQTFLLEVVNRLKDQIPNLHLLLAGQGELEDFYKLRTIQLGLLDNVTFLGFRNDMEKIYALADVGVSSSRQEGLPVNVLEMIAAGLPVVATDVRGNRDLVEEGVHGFLAGLDDPALFAERIWELYANPALQQMMSSHRERLTDLYSVSHVVSEMEPLYLENTFKGKVPLTANKRGGLDI